MPPDHTRTAESQTTQPPVKAPSHAERCRTLMLGVRAATLCTIAHGRAAAGEPVRENEKEHGRAAAGEPVRENEKEHGRAAAGEPVRENERDRDTEGYPFGSLVTVAFDKSGRPLLLLSQLAEHTQNLKHRADASLLLSEPLDRHAQPLALSRVTLLGPCRPVIEPERADVRATFLAAQPDASYYVDFSDFAFFRLEPVALRYVGGFGRMSWVTAEDYLAAEADPLAGAAADILSHMNGDHADAVLAYARALAGITSATAATMTAVDRYGFELAATTPDGPKAGRVAFETPVTTSDEVRKAMIALVRDARARLP